MYKHKVKEYYCYCEALFLTNDGFNLNSFLTKTKWAPHIYTMNMSKKLEITSSSYTFSPAHSVSLLAEWAK